MTVSAQTLAFEYTANGVTTTFPYQCRILFVEQLKVYVDGVLQVGGYTVFNVGNQNGGDVVFSVAPANGATVLIRRISDRVRTTDFQQAPYFTQEELLDLDQDYQTMLVQEAAAEGDKSIRIPSEETVNTILPSASERAGKQITFGANGEVQLTNTAAAIAGADLVFAATKSAADSLAAGLGDGATVIVDRDETRGGVRVRYLVLSGLPVSPVLDELLACFESRQDFIDSDIISPAELRASFIVEGRSFNVIRDASGPIEQTNGERWAPDGDAYSDHFGIPRNGTDSSRAGVEEFLLYCLTTGKKGIFVSGEYFWPGGESSSTITVPVDYKDFHIYCEPGVKFIAGSVGDKFDGSTIRFTTPAGRVTKPFEERPTFKWINGEFDQRNVFNSGVVPFSTLGEVDVGLSNVCTALLLTFVDTDGGNRKAAFRSGEIDGIRFVSGDSWEISGGDQQIEPAGLGITHIKNCYFQAARDLGLYASGCDDDVYTIENNVSKGCVGSLAVKRNGKKITFINNTAIDCIVGESTTTVDPFEGGEEVISIGARTIRTEIPFDFRGGRNLLTRGGQHVQNGYAYLQDWDNGVNSAVTGQRIAGVHPGGVPTGPRIRGVLGVDAEYQISGLNPNITSGSTAMRGFTVDIETVNSVARGAEQVSIKATMRDIASVGVFTGSPAANKAILDLDIDNVTNQIDMGGCTNYAVKTFNLTTGLRRSLYSGEVSAVDEHRYKRDSATSGVLQTYNIYGGTDGNTLYSQVIYDQRSDGAIWVRYLTRNSSGVVGAAFEVRGDQVRAEKQIFAQAGIRIVGEVRKEGTVCPSGTFTTVDGKTITVSGGLITGIA